MGQAAAWLPTADRTWKICPQSCSETPKRMPWKTDRMGKPRFKVPALVRGVGTGLLSVYRAPSPNIRHN